MSRSTIFASNTTPQALTAGSGISFGNVVRRFGCNCRLNGNALILSGVGYYDVDVNVVVRGSAAGTAEIVLLKDGVAIPGATASTATSTTSINTVSVHALVRELCCEGGSTLTLELRGVDATIGNVSAVVEKL